ncbi:Lipopolysaccharide assembly protein A [Paraglaciecola mesophila]|uniref:Probable lipopolysaccharide assembly protein A n=1 Tax=Paraglaciecola mesophila TaxID=197222 RepID=A0A857JF12_9ALTE|nr:lipopolysaccharide assembly protein LapA domain-containing protein [Paraglaciecola mesophila]QHJ10599.1 Lipopolysaccharide assembly protein A [Paraglaciecola mesophila]
MKLKGLLSLIAVLVLLIVGGFIGSQNTHSVMVNYLIAQSELRVSLLMLIVFLCGVFFSIIVFSLYILRLKWRVVSLERQLKKSNRVESA